MTTSVPPSGWGQDADLPRQAHWREYGAALLPLALLGLLPGWAALLLCALLALSVRYERWREARLLVGLLIVGLAILPAVFSLVGTAQSGIGSQLLSLGSQYLSWLFGLGLVYWSVVFLEAGQRRGLLTLLGAGLLSPQPLLLLALAGGALLRPGVDDRLSRIRAPTPQEQQVKRLAWGGLAAAILAAVLGALLLPRPAADSGQPAPTVTRPLPERPVNAAPPEPDRGAASPVTVRPNDRAVMEQLGLSPPPYELLSTLLILNVLAVLLMAWRLAGASIQRRKMGLLDILMVAGLLLTLVLSVLLSLGGQTGQGVLPLQPLGQGNLPQAVAPLSAGDIQRVKQRNLLSWAFFLVQLGVMLLVMWLLWKNRPRLSQNLVLADESGALMLEKTMSEPPALHRVRLAYRQAETALTGAGYGRLASETPVGYAARLSQMQPTLNEPLNQLTRIYSPVRYGGQVSDEHAAEAEQAAAEVALLAATLPRLDNEPSETPGKA